ncbi:MAG: endo alpha-1,4 polygalactosaminidase [Anaerolineaceae bacterium]|nr:endo alpha-1,4 polygalactosaminidase [Anaerolineaceae bacterium]
MGSQSAVIRNLILNLIGLLLLTAILSACQNTDSLTTLYPTRARTPVVVTDYPIPKPGSSFSIQFSGEINPEDLTGDVIDLDLFETEPEMVQALQDQDKLVMCYLSAGSWEDWRPDADLYPPEVIGKNYEGWPGEKWLDIRQIETLAPILENRLDLCLEKGFDGVEADNMDNYQNNTGFDIQPEDQLTFNRWIALQAHNRGLSIGLKNDPDQAAELVEDFDWALVEDCFAEGWCDEYTVFINQGKAVFVLEYSDRFPDKETTCQKAQSLGLTVVFKNRSLNEFADNCP